jgi:predicted nucleic acid-binding protein
LTLVLDASIALAWVLPGESAPRTEALHQRVKRDGAYASHVWRLEVTNIIVQAERARRITEADTGRIVTMLDSLPIAIDRDGVDQVFGRVVDLARTTGLTTYDASYIELAIRLGLPLATNDGPMTTAANNLGVNLL